MGGPSRVKSGKESAQVDEVDEEKADEGPANQHGMEKVGEDIKQFGEQVAKRVDRVIKKKA